MKLAFGTTLRNSLPLAALLLAACGGGGGGTPAPAGGPTPPTPIKLAGAIQGPQPTLAGKVTTFAGAGVAATFGNPQATVSDGTFLYVANSLTDTIDKLELATGIKTTLAGGQDCTSMGCTYFADGIGAAAHFNNPSALTLDAAKTNLYVADTNNFRIRQVNIATGAVTTIAGTGGWANTNNTTGTLASFSLLTGIVADASNLYVTDQYNCAVRQISLTSPYAVITLAGDTVCRFADTAVTTTTTLAVIGSFSYPSALTIVGGNLYIADMNNLRIRKVAIAADAVTGMPAGAISTVAGSGGYGFADNPNGLLANFAYPQAVSSDGANLLFVADTDNQRIRQIDLTTTAVTTLAGSGVCCSAVDGVGAAAAFSYPGNLSFDAGTLYLGENQNIRKVDIASATVSTLYNSNFKDGAATTARFSNLGDVATDGVSLFTADASNNLIRQTNIATGITSTLAGTVGVAGFVDATGTAATFNHPIGITTDGTNVFVADANNNTIRQIVISTGAVTTLAGSPNTWGAVDATGAAASFDYPTAVTTDGTNVYVADSNNNKIRQIVIKTGVVTTLAGTGVYGGTDGAGLTAATFGYPGGITTDGKNLYVMNDYGTSLRQVVIATGVTTTLAGTYSFSGALDGIGAAASFGCWNDVAGITTDGTNVYVADACNGKVRKVVIATGVVSSVTGLGNTSALPAGVVNPLSSWLSGITTDGTSLFVTDSNNRQIKKVQ
ncbi:MAG: hypothetical protein ACXW1C_00850 [Gallionella sp.]